jgi:tRNA threonylcarbamoyladenosine biosynthesis protein TsaE
LRFRTKSAAETYSFGRSFADHLQAGDILCLRGDLGAGKTHLVQGIAAGLDVNDGVTSPTFTILQIYDTGRIPIFHFDLYRLENPDELFDIGFEEYVGTSGVTIIEWADKFAGEMPAECLWVELTVGMDVDERIIELFPAGKRYQQLCEEMNSVASTCFRYSDSGVQRGAGNQ